MIICAKLETGDEAKEKIQGMKREPRLILTLCFQLKPAVTLKGASLPFSRLCPEPPQAFA